MALGLSFRVANAGNARRMAYGLVVIRVVFGRSAATARPPRGQKSSAARRRVPRSA